MGRPDPRIPASLRGNLRLQRDYLLELQRLGGGGCGGGCAKAELDRKYANIVRKQAELDNPRRRR